MIYSKKWMVVPYESDDESNILISSNNNVNVLNNISDYDRVNKIQQDAFKSEQKALQLEQEGKILQENSKENKSFKDEIIKEYEKDKLFKQQRELSEIKKYDFGQDIEISKLKNKVEKQKKQLDKSLGINILPKKTKLIKNNINLETSHFNRGPAQDTRLAQVKRTREKINDSYRYLNESARVNLKKKDNQLNNTEQNKKQKVTILKKKNIKTNQQNENIPIINHNLNLNPIELSNALKFAPSKPNTFIFSRSDGSNIQVDANVNNITSSDFPGDLSMISNV
jgi:hypothetical protein